MAYTTPGGTLVHGPKGHWYTASPELEAELGAQYESLRGAEEQEIAALEDHIASLPGAERAGRQAIRADAAKALGLTMGQTGAMPVGGGAAAALRQTGLESGLARARFETEVVPGMRAAAVEAAGQLAGLRQGQMDRQRAARVDAMNQINKIKARYEGFFTDDTSAMARAITELAEREADPATQAYLYREAARIRETPSNLFTKMWRQL